MDFSRILLSHPTYVGTAGVGNATPAATYAFFTADYQPPRETRYISTDIVKNQNGKFKYVYDNGPGFAKWSPFNIHCEDSFSVPLAGNGLTQYTRLREMWRHPGTLGLTAPEGTYVVHWGEDFDRAFRVFPKSPSSPQEFVVTVQFEEG